MIKFIRIFLLVLIVAGIGLLCTQNLWVPGLVNAILKSENTQIEPNQTTQAKLNIYTEQAGAYSFNYDPSFSVVNGDKTQPTTDWKVNNLAQTEGIILSTLTIPKSYMPSTNFSGAKFTVGRSDDALAIKNCLVAENGEKVVGDAVIDGQAFKEISLNDAGAGNFYDTTSYRAVLDEECYAVEYTIHYSNIGNYSPDQGIKQFDESKIQNELESIVQSLKFQLASS